MKIELETNDIERIVEKVVEQLTPLLKHNCNSSDSNILTVNDLSDYIKVKTTWIYEKVHTRGIPFYKAGKFPRFRKKHIDIWLSNPYHPDLNIYNLNHKERR